ncbi:MAG: citrate lyase acyl carrier protein [Candidatus Izemoplasmataceae bacterium]|jgi:citrate lyase subunit gamma (acyl carrier protein)|uniref:citrate lyase acyl carrier protein n=1 Tax=Liberiplasma polymorphum TaxID=3374570 RepID=UPI003772B11E
MPNIIVGSLESSDCMITLKAHKDLKIDIESIVFDAFGKQIEKVIKRQLKKHNISNIYVLCQDKGALDYTIEARLETAILRFKEATNES